MLTCGDLSDFLFKKLSDKDLLTKEKLYFNKIKFRIADL